MKFLKKKRHEALFFEEEPVDARFNMLADFVRELDSKADYNKAIGAMESIFNAYQKLRGIKVDDDVIEESKFILSDKEGE